MSNADYEQLEGLVLALPQEQQERLMRRLRESIGLHPLEVAWNTDAKTILDAIERGTDLTQRGIRGILAEAALGTHVIEGLEGWRDTTPAGDIPYDYRIEDAIAPVRIQVKNQRREKGKPKTGGKKYGQGMYIVEVQKTRSGNTTDGDKTRPYRFGDFDILAVSLHAATGDWANFLFTVANWLIASPNNGSWIQTFQPVPASPNEVWTANLLEAIAWFRSGEHRTIWPLK